MTDRTGFFVYDCTPKIVQATRYLGSLPVEEFEKTDWPDLLAHNPDVDVLAMPLKTIERIPLNVFRRIRAIRGTQVKLSRTLLEEAKNMARAECAGEPLAEFVRDMCIKDSWAPFLTAPVLEVLRKKGLLPHYALSVEDFDETMNPVIALMLRTSINIKKHIGIDDAF